MQKATSFPGSSLYFSISQVRERTLGTRLCKRLEANKWRHHETSYVAGGRFVKIVTRLPKNIPCIASLSAKKWMTSWRTLKRQEIIIPSIVQPMSNEKIEPLGVPAIGDWVRLHELCTEDEQQVIVWLSRCWKPLNKQNQRCTLSWPSTGGMNASFQF